MVNKNKNLHEMNNHELLEFMIDFVKEYANNLSTITTGNLSHRIANLKYGLIKCSDSVKRIMEKNDEKEKTIQ